MSEVLVIPPGTSNISQFGLKISSSEAVQLIRFGRKLPIEAIGSSASDSIRTTQFAIDRQLRYNLDGKEGNDTLKGGIGKDLIKGGLGDDNLSGGGGNDTILGEAGNDILKGDLGNDTLRGGLGNDTLRGGEGNDVLVPGEGKDLMVGGPDADRFRFEADTTIGSASNVSRIADFDPDQDIIQISRNLLSQSNVKQGKLAANSFTSVDRIGNVPDNSRAVIIYERTTGLVYYNAPGGQEIPLFQVQRNLNIAASDFEIL
jgi:Ca2+-binding RTX toxin-like protein